MNSPSPIAVKFELSFGEMFSAVFRSAVGALRVLFILEFVGLLLFAISGFVAASESSWSHNASVLEDWIAPILVGAIPTTLLFVPLVCLARTWMIFRSSSLGGVRSYFFSDSGIRVATELTVSELQWAFYRYVVETKASFCLYFSWSMCNVIPKRAFATTDDMEIFRFFVRTHVKKYKLVD
jgi:hypothetical protein